jgi:hypothetical protein
MKRLLYTLSILSLLLAGILFYEHFTWPNPSVALMSGNYLTEYFVIVTNSLTVLNIQATPKHDTEISSVNIISAFLLLIVSVVLYLTARKKQ